MFSSLPSTCRRGPSRRPWLPIVCPREQGRVLCGRAWGRENMYWWPWQSQAFPASERKSAWVRPLSRLFVHRRGPLGRCDHGASGRKFSNALGFWSLGSSMDRGGQSISVAEGLTANLGTAAICLKLTSFTPHVLGFCMHAPEVTPLQSGPRVPSVWPWDAVTGGNLVRPSRWPCSCLQPLPPIARGPSSWSSFRGPLCGPVTTGPLCDLLPEPASPVPHLPGAAPGPCRKRPEE